MTKSNKLKLLKTPPKLLNIETSLSPGIKFKINKAFLDVIEKLNSLIIHKFEMLNQKSLAKLK